ncbi:MAG: DctP family TRAP transporter solute-binding subunit [Burkholderiaceae bacterium]|nr:DctP family TRAP transporter solute-binding subunit [Burkholderiaceae bacterium]
MTLTRRPLLAALAAASALSALPVMSQTAKLIKYAHYQPGRADQPKHAAALAFKEHVEKVTAGALKVEIYPAGQLGPAQQVMEGLRLGTVELAVIHDGGVAGSYKPFNIFGMPFVFDNHAHSYAVLDGAFGKAFADEMRKRTGIRLLGFGDNGVRHFTNSKRAIRTLEDMKGLKMRVQPGPVFIKMVEALGASPTAIDWGELPAALAQGTADGQENGVTNILAASLYQHQKFATLDGHIYSQHAYAMSDRFFNGLTPAQKMAVEEGFVKAQKIHRDMTREQDLAAKKVLGEKGMTVTELTPAEVERFRRQAQPPVKAWLEAEVSRDWTDRLLAAASAARK